MLPPSARADFQDRPQWRSAVIATLADADAAAQSPVLVPMTLVNPEYFAEIMSGLRERDIDVRHISLVASPDTLRQRLRSRSAYWVGRIAGREETWAMAQIDRCVTALGDQRFAEHIDTDGVRLDEVVEAVAARIGVPLRRRRLDPIRFQAHRISIGVRHLRI